MQRLLNKYRNQWKNKPASWYFFPLAQIYYRLGKYEDAYQACRQGLQNWPNLLAARVELAQVCLKMGLKEEAEAQLEAVVKELPNNLLASKLLAQLYLEQGRPGAALGRYRAISNFYPECADLKETIRRLEETELQQAKKTLAVLEKWQAAILGTRALST